MEADINDNPVSFKLITNYATKFIWQFLSNTYFGINYIGMLGSSIAIVG